MADNAAVVAVSDEGRGLAKVPHKDAAAWWGRVLSAVTPAERKRLRGDIETQRSDLTKLLADPAVAPGAWSTEAKALLDRASDEMRAGDIDCGWKFLHEAQRQTLFGYGLERLDAHKLALRSEADEKLAAWRKEAVLALIDGIPEGATIETRRIALREATRIRDDHTDNVYFRYRLIRTQMQVIAIALLFLLGLFLAVLWTQPNLGDALRTRDLTMATFCVAMLLGGMGACLSALITFSTSSTAMRIPAHLAAGLITAARPLIGMVSGVVALLLLKSGFMNLPPDATPWIAPFAFGFSERLVMGALAKAHKE